MPAAQCGPRYFNVSLVPRVLSATRKRQDSGNEVVLMSVPEVARHTFVVLSTNQLQDQDFPALSRVHQLYVLGFS